MKDEDITPAAIQKEVEKWGTYVNLTVGVLSFSFGLSALGTPNPSFYAGVSLLFLIVLHVYVCKSEQFKFLMSVTAESDPSDLKCVAKNDFESKLKARGLWPLIFGYTFLWCVAVMSYMPMRESLRTFFLGSTI